MTKICCIIPTKDRPIDIKNVLTSLAEQSVLPTEVIIIDGSDNPVKSIVNSLNFPWVSYYTLRPPGLARQKNKGISLALEKDYDWIGFLDDDLVLEPKCIENLASSIKKYPKVKGIGLAINNQPVVNFPLIKKAILIDDGKGGYITKSGCPSHIRTPNNDQKVDWIYGGATFWHREVITNFNFDEWFSGVGYFEDVDYSYRVSREHELLISADARCWHYHHPVPNEKLKALGEWHFTAWWYFSQKVGIYNKVLTLYSMTALFVFNFLTSLTKRNKKGLLTSSGNFKALLRIIKGNAKELKGFQK
jgi:GT2 family glycosyltransferase